MVLRAMTPEEEKRWSESFGKGLVIFGQKRPDSSTSTSTASVTPQSKERQTKAREQAMGLVSKKLGVKLTEDNLHEHPGAGLEVALQSMEILSRPTDNPSSTPAASPDTTTPGSPDKA